MSEKVKLPRKIAERLDDIIGNPFNDSFYSQLMEYKNKYPSDITQNSWDKVIEAIVNGYVVEETPEEKIWDFYHTKASCDMHPHHAIQHVLNILNIKIDGVNK